MSNLLKDMIVQDRNGDWKERLKNEDRKYRRSIYLPILKECDSVKHEPV